MICVYFRFIGTDWVGLVAAKDMSELFWAIDEQGDPYQVEIKDIGANHYASVTVNTITQDYDLSEGFYGLGGWYIPEWPENPYTEETP